MSEKLVEELKRALPDGLAGMIFDCDGVLLDSWDSHVVFYNLVRSYFDLPPMSEADKHYVHMHTSMQSFAHILPPHCMERLGEAMQDIDYVRDIAPYITASKGISELLQWLREKGIKLAVHTNRTSLAGEILSCFHLRDYFELVVTAGTHQPKPSPEGVFAILDSWQVEPGKVLFVGDSLLDEKAASAAGVGLVAYRNPELDAAVYVNDFKQFLAALDQVLGPC